MVCRAQQGWFLREVVVQIDPALPFLACQRVDVILVSGDDAFTAQQAQCAEARVFRVRNG